MQLKWVAVVAAVSLLTGGYLGYSHKSQIGAGVTEVNKDTGTVVTEVKRVKHGDGTVETQKTITEHKNVVATVTAVPPRLWRVELGALYNPDKAPGAVLSVHRRVLDNVWVGVSADTNGAIGALVGVEF